MMTMLRDRLGMTPVLKTSQPAMKRVARDTL
jgi:hypothetical protein